MSEQFTMSELAHSDGVVGGDQAASGTENSFCQFNVGGTTFVLSQKTITDRGGRLADLVNGTVQPELTFKKRWFFERSPSFFQFIYSYYVSGKLHRPKDMCPKQFAEEVEYWKIGDGRSIEPCCAVAEETAHNEEQLESGEQATNMSEHVGGWRKTIWEFLQNPNSSPKAYLFAWFSALLTFLSICSLVAGTVSELQESKQMKSGTVATQSILPIRCFDQALFVFFAIELALKLAISPHRLKMIKSAADIIDFLACISFSIELGFSLFGATTLEFAEFEGAPVVIKIVRFLRIFRILKIGKYSIGIWMLAKSMKSALRQLVSMGIVVASGVLFFSTLVYFFERNEPNTPFTSIPMTCWWGVVSISTVGYGDMTPSTNEGKLVASLAIAFGVMIFAIPNTIAVNALLKFAEENEKNGSRSTKGRSTNQRLL